MFLFLIQFEGSDKDKEKWLLIRRHDLDTWKSGSILVFCKLCINMWESGLREVLFFCKLCIYNLCVTCYLLIYFLFFC